MIQKDIDHFAKLERNERELAAESTQDQIIAIHTRLADEYAARRVALEREAARRETLKTHR